MVYGFKLFETKVVKNLRGQRALEVSEVGKDGREHYADFLGETLLPKLIYLGNLTGKPSLTGNDGSSDLDPVSNYQNVVGITGDPRTRFETVRLDSRSVFFKVTYGHIGHYDVAVGRSPQDDARIQDKSASRTYRCVFLLPERGTKGVLAVEWIRGNNPAGTVERWLKRAGYECAREEHPLLPIYGFGMTPVVDLDRLREVLREANEVKIHLGKRTISGSSNRPKRTLVLENTVSATNLDGIMAWVRRFTGLSTDKVPGDGIVELAGLVEGDVGGLDFNEGYVVIDTDSGVKKIGPEHLDRFFVYPVSEDRWPSDDAWLQQVRSVVRGLEAKIEVDLDLF